MQDASKRIQKAMQHVTSKNSDKDLFQVLIKLPIDGVDYVQTILESYQFCLKLMGSLINIRDFSGKLSVLDDNPDDKKHF